MTNRTDLHKRSGQPQQHSHIIISQQFSGPLPHPDILERYERILPNAAERILRKFEEQADHRTSLERSVIKTINFNSTASLFLGFTIAITAVMGGLIAALHGIVFLGGSLSFAGIALIVGAFIGKQKTEQK